MDTTEIPTWSEHLPFEQPTTGQVFRSMCSACMTKQQLAGQRKNSSLPSATY